MPIPDQSAQFCAINNAGKAKADIGGRTGQQDIVDPLRTLGGSGHHDSTVIGHPSSEVVAHKGFEDQHLHQGLAMTRRYDTITQLRYGPEVMVQLPFATPCGRPDSPGKETRQKALCG